METRKKFYEYWVLCASAANGKRTELGIMEAVFGVYVTNLEKSAFNKNCTYCNGTSKYLA